MAQQYFSQTPESRSCPNELQVELFGRRLRFTADSGVFCRDRLDYGSEVLLKAIPHGTLGQRILEIGCGWGPVCCFLKVCNPDSFVTAVDVNERAVELTVQNFKRNGLDAEAFVSDGTQNCSGEFDTVVTNPPIRAGKKVIYRIFSQSYDCLVKGGRLFIVIRKQQGAPSAQKYLEELFETVCIIERSDGYWVMECVK